ncbi:MAG: hypothetical protein H0T44_06505 [Gemmatimonadales bacterium]|nr:hypothetical protein [Gemmatimonadales bacterium]
MSRLVVGLVMAVALLVSACSEQPTEVSPPAAEAGPSAAAVATCTTSPDEILALINQVLPRGPLRASVAALVNALPPRAQDRIKLVVRNRIFVIQDLILRGFYAGRLNGGTSDETFDKVLRLIAALYRYVCLTPPVFPEVDEGSDVVAGVVFPNSPTTTLAVPSGNAAVTIPAGAAPAPTTIVISILPDSPGPLNTTLNQYPLFYKFSGTTATGPVEFRQVVTAGVCLRNNPGEGVNLDDLRLAHNIGLNFGDVEVLPLVDGPEVPGLDCSDVPEAPIGQVGAARGAALDFMLQALAPLSRALLPQPLSATSLLLATVGVGGTTRKFSPFGVVDIESNPARLDYSPDADAFSSLAAEPGGTVTPPSVTLRSAKGDPIPDWPVVFTVTSGEGSLNGATTVTVNTGSNGVAGVGTWTLGEGPGINTVTASPRTVEQSSPSLPYRPAGVFAPASLNFTATATGGIDYESSGWRYLVSANGSFPLPIADFDEPDYEDTGWSTGAAGFGQDDGPGGNQCDLVLNASATVWPTGTEILIRKPFSVPDGVSSVQVSVAVDNDAKVFVNGTDVTASAGAELNGDGFVSHEGCPTQGSFVFTAPVTDGVNWLAIHARDRGGSSYVDAEVSAGVLVE